MSYEVRLASKAAAYLKRVDRQTQERILNRIDQIRTDPYGRMTKPLANSQGRRAARVGRWRIIYSVDDDRSIVEISMIGPRGQVYRDI